MAPKTGRTGCAVHLPRIETRENEPEATSAATQAPCLHRLSWAKLLARVFDIDVSQCPACGGRMKIIAALTEPQAIRQYLPGVGLPARPPPIAPPKASPQPELEFAA